MGNSAGVSFSEMMETAGVSTARAVLERLRDDVKNITVICGRGKNGGDGFVVAEEISKCLFYNVSVILAMGEPREELQRSKFERLKDTDISIMDYTANESAVFDIINEADVIIDAIFGIGFSGDLGGELGELIEAVNASHSRVFACDIPSGLSADSADLPEIYVKADCTCTMLAMKTAHVMKPASLACGETVIIDIGIKASCLNESDFLFLTKTLDEIKLDFPGRAYNSHKGDFGHVLSICGSYQMPGAAVFAARAACECGAGLVTAAFPSPAYPAIASKLCEPLMKPVSANEFGRFAPFSLDELDEQLQKASVALLGCGMGLDMDTEKFTNEIIKNTNCPLIIDADGINAVSRNINVLKEVKGQILLSPHPGEMSRLCGLSVEEINADRHNIAKKYAGIWNAIVVLKGENTVIAAPDGRVTLNNTGCPGMSRGGSGDVLSGMIAAFAAQGLSLYDAACDAVYLHGAAGEMAAEQYSPLASTPSRLLEVLPLLLKNL